jgi:hypothetical protein
LSIADAQTNEVPESGAKQEANKGRDIVFMVVALVVGLILAATLGRFCAIEGDTFGIDLVNDTDQRLQFLQCGGDCDSFYQMPHADSGENVGINNTVGVVNLWQVRDEEGNVLGCFRIDFDHRPGPDEDDLYVSRDLGPCVE